MGKLKLSLLLAAILVGLAVPVISGLNYSGLCISEGRYLTEQELIDIGIREEFRSYPPRTYPGLLPKVTKPIQYASFDDFIARNPNCCSLTRTAREDFSPAFFHRILGHFAGFVRMEYRVEEDVPDVPEMYVSHIAITNCGIPWNGIGFR